MPDAGHTTLQGLGYWEISKLHYHAGDRVEVVFRIPQDGEEGGRLTASVVNPAGEQVVAELRENGAGSYTLSFIPEEEGYYQLLLEQEKATSRHLAKAILPVGHHPQGGLFPIRAALELVPLEWKDWQAGDPLKLRAMLGDRPAPGAPVNLLYRGPLDDMPPVTVKTGRDGEVEFTFPQPGKYMVVAAVEAGRDCPALTASLPVLVTKTTDHAHEHHDHRPHSSHHHHQ